MAAKWGKANMVTLLCERGANQEAKTRDGLTPLHCGARSGHENVVDLMLEKGAFISAKTKVTGEAGVEMARPGWEMARPGWGWEARFEGECSVAVMVRVNGVTWRAGVKPGSHRHRIG